MIDYLFQDFHTENNSSVETPKLLTVRGLCTVLLRLAQLAGRKSPRAAFAVKQLNHILTGADIAWQAQLGTGLNLFHPTGVVIGGRVVVGSNCKIQQGVTLGSSGGRIEGNPIIGDNVHIGAGAKIMGPVTIGSGATIGANAVVRNDVPENSTAVGVPAKILR